jgi:octopine/nopaline transport system substrate-binding protein
MREVHMSVKILIYALALSLAASANAPAAEPPVIRIATDGAYPPYMATKADGSLYGLEADLFADVCRRMKARCTWVRQSFDGLIPALQRGRFDAIVSSLSTTDERRKVIDFSVPYFVGPTVFMSLGDGAYRSRLAFTGAVILDAPSATERRLIADTKRALEGATVGIERATTHETFLKAYFADAIRIKTYGTKEELFLDLASGRVDLAVTGLGEMDETFMKEQAKAGRKLVASGPHFRGGPLGHGVAVGLRKGDGALRQRFDQAILEANRDGTIKKFGLKWFAADGSPPLPATTAATR